MFTINDANKDSQPCLVEIIASRGLLARLFGGIGIGIGIGGEAEDVHSDLI